MSDSDESDYPIDEAQIEAILSGLERDGIAWFTLVRPKAEKHLKEVKRRFEKLLESGTLKPYSEYVIFDPDRLPDKSWLGVHAQTRADLLDRGVPEDQLPALPRGIYPKDK
ncbi:MAG TPA: hypothetical protein VGG27_18870 [Magnetospirillaceae bacterium]